MNIKNNNNKKSDIKDRTIARQAKEIESLKTEISKLEAICKEKDIVIAKKKAENAEIANSAKALRAELKENINELKAKSKEYDDTLADIRNMKTILNQEIFKGRWSLIKLLIK